MKRVMLVLAAVVFAGSVAFADVTMTMTLSMGAANMTVEGTTVTSMKGTKLRAESKVLDQEIVLLGDGATKQIWRVDRGAKTVEPFNPQQALAAMTAIVGDVKVAMTPNGQTKEVLGQVCRGYTLEMTMPMAMQGETVTMRMTGTAWMTREGPGIAELLASQQTFADLGVAMSPLGQGPQLKALMEASKTVAGAGVTLEQTITMTMEGTGEIVQRMNQMGGMTMTTRVTNISTEPVPDEKFAIPEGYVKK